VIVTGPATINKSGARSPALASPLETAVGPDTPVILDSNVWIDLLVFADATVKPIRDALDADKLHVVIDDACLRELRYVLLYPQFARFAVDDAQAVAQTCAWTHAVASIAEGAEAQRAATDETDNTDDGADAAGASVPPTPGDALTRAAVRPSAPPGQPILPKCSDRDDQKFLTLAAASGARWLVTKDKALLKLHHRMLRDFNCHVVLPAVFTAQALGAR
jgi:predicted nucleic acid-binding protein